MDKQFIGEMEKYFEELSLSKETGKYLSDKSYGYDTIFFISRFIQRNKIGNQFNKGELRQKAIEYVKDIFSLTAKATGAVNYFSESLNLLEFANIIKKVGNNNYIIENNAILEYICKCPENAYIFVYLVAYSTMKNDNILEIFKKLYNKDNTEEINKNLINEMYKEIEGKSISIRTDDTNWSKQIVRYTNTVLGFLNSGIYITRELKIRKKR